MLTRLTKAITLGWLFCTGKMEQSRAEEIFAAAFELIPEKLPLPSVAVNLSLACVEEFALEAGAITSSTTLWLFGEFHNKQAVTTACVEELTAPYGPHKIYLEDVTANRQIPCSEAGFLEFPWRICIGWDDVPASLKITNLLMGNAVGDLISVLENYDANGMPAIGMDAILLHLSVKENIFQLASAQLLKLRKNNESYQQIFARKINYIAPPVSKAALLEVKRLCRYRNAKLITITQLMKMNEHSIFIAGKAHFAKKDQNGVEDTCASNDIKHSLEIGKHKNKFAILAMR